MSKGEMLNINSEYLTELIDYASRACVGKVMKRFEIIENKDIIKSDVRELIYEEFRNFYKLVEAHTKGLNLRVMKFTRPQADTPTQQG